MSGHGMTVFFGLLRRFAPRNDALRLYAVLRMPRFARNDDLASDEGCEMGCKISFLLGVFSLFEGAVQPENGCILVEKG